MRVIRVFVETPLSGRASMLIEGTAAGHITRVLRLRVGDALTLFDGRGGEYPARLTDLRRGGVQVELGEHRRIERESPLDLTLLQSIARGERMDLIVQKSTELGVTRIAPVLSERTVVRLAPDQSARKLAHWRAIAIAACEQCGRNRVPQIAEPQALAPALGGGDAEGGAARILLDPGADAPLAARIAGTRQITLLVGPEGGLTRAEIELAARAGFRSCRLGARVMRTETAALACLAALQTIAGDFGA